MILYFAGVRSIFCDYRNIWSFLQKFSWFEYLKLKSSWPCPWSLPLYSEVWAQRKIGPKEFASRRMAQCITAIMQYSDMKQVSFSTQAFLGHHDHISHKEAKHHCWVATWSLHCSYDRRTEANWGMNYSIFQFQQLARVEACNINSHFC